MNQLRDEKKRGQDHRRRDVSIFFRWTHDEPYIATAADRFRTRAAGAREPGSGGDRLVDERGGWKTERRLIRQDEVGVKLHFLPARRVHISARGSRHFV